MPYADCGNWIPEGAIVELVIVPQEIVDYGPEVEDMYCRGSMPVMNLRVVEFEDLPVFLQAKSCAEMHGLVKSTEIDRTKRYRCRIRS